MYIELSTDKHTIEEIDEILNSIEVNPGEAAIGIQFPDNTYRVIGKLVKDPDCPSDVFQQALQIMADFRPKI